MTMQGTSIIAGMVVAALVFGTPKSASATTAPSSTNHYDQPDGGMVQEARYWGRRYVRPYGYGYYDYPSYGYYRPYGYYGGYGNPYWSRPGVSVWFGF
jgi:hypothetical protein